MQNLITVIICTYNRSELLQKALNSLVNQDAKNVDFEVLVIDNNSTDNTKDIVKSFYRKLNLRYVFEKKQGLSNARNRGVAEASGEFLAFVDDDAILPSDWLRQLSFVIKKYNPSIFGGPIFPYYNHKKPKWFLDKYEIRKISNNKRFLKKTEFLSGSNMVFHYKIFQRIGYFKTDFGMLGKKISLGEESELLARAHKSNVRIFYVPNLYVLHFTPLYKMSVLYMAERYFISSKSAFYFLSSDKFIANLRLFVVGLFELFFLLLFVLIRSRKKYPYWQNFFVEKILPRIRGIIWFWMFIFVKKK